MDYIEKIRSKYIGNYGNEIIDRFYDMTLDDRLKLIEKLIRLNNEIKSSEYGWQYTDHKKDLEIVKEVTSIIKKAEQFTEFYNSLNDKQKKELQTQVYIESEYSKTWAMSKHKHKCISRIYVPYRKTPKRNNDLFEFDINLLNEELKTSRLLSRITLIEIFCSFYTEYAFDNYLEWDYDYKNPEVKKYRRLYTLPLLKEFNNAITEVSRVLKNNLNDSIKEEYNSLTKEQQVSVISGILSIDEENLDRYIEYRDKKRQEEKVKKLIK